VRDAGVIAEWRPVAVVALAVLGALAVAAVWPGAAHVAALLVSPLAVLGLP